MNVIDFMGSPLNADQAEAVVNSNPQSKVEVTRALIDAGLGVGTEKHIKAYQFITDRNPDLPFAPKNYGQSGNQKLTDVAELSTEQLDSLIDFIPASKIEITRRLTSAGIHTNSPLFNKLFTQYVQNNPNLPLSK